MSAHIKKPRGRSKNLYFSYRAYNKSAVFNLLYKFVIHDCNLANKEAVLVGLKHVRYDEC